MLSNLTTKKNIRTFSISPENFTGEKGKGAMAEVGSASYAARDLGKGWKVNPYIVLKGKTTAVLGEAKGQGAIKHFWITDAGEGTGRYLILRIYFDGQKNPAVCVPLSDFFCGANDKDYKQVSALPICFNPRKGLNCYFEMPYFKSFRMELENIGPYDYNVYYQIDCEEKEIPKDSLYFHACFNRINPLPYKEVYPILEGIKGNGHYVGTYLYWGVKSNGWWGEGEIKFYIDGDKEYPSICGTGTEDYFCGSYDFEVNGKYVDFSTPYTGFSVGSTDETYKCQKYFNMYRFHITDPIYFKKDLRVTVQALGWRSEYRYLPLQDDISSVAYWYSDNLEDEYQPMKTVDELEMI